MQADRVSILVTILVSVLVAAAAFLAGWFLTPSPLANILVGTIAGLLLAVSGGGLIVMYVRALRQRRYSPDLADQWERDQVARRERRKLKAFWESPLGRWVRRNPVIADESVRIVPRGTPQSSYSGYGRFVAQVSESEEMRGALHPSWTWRDVLSDWIGRFLMCLRIREKPEPDQTARMQCGECETMHRWGYQQAEDIPDNCPTCGTSWEEQAAGIRAFVRSILSKPTP